MSHYNSVVWGPKFTNFLLTWKGLQLMMVFPIFDMTIRSEDIRDQSRKLSKIAPNLGRFFALPNFRGWAFRKLYSRYHPCPAARQLESFMRILPLDPKLLWLIGWILGQILNFHDKNFWGTPVPVGCALGSLGQSLTRVEIWGVSTNP